ncbi:MAG TPA: TetR/AcrR family transcriptional regulator [Arenicellales bacterium]|nr:TetR/AcrR family transcriptional regulator [Arenicellales bacterium]
MKDSNTATTLRADNRRQALVDAAAAAFREHGYHAASMREVAGRVGMLAGSMYYHFRSKDDLLLAVYAEGVQRLCDQVRSEIEGIDDPVERLQAALEAHLDSLLDGSDYGQVVIRVLPKDAPGVEDQLVALRTDYENIFKTLIDELDMTTEKKQYLRLFLIGASNWAQVWYHKGGDSPRTIARQLMNCLDLGR